MEAIKTYRDLEVWQQAIGLAVQIYKHTKKYPKEETYSLTSQTQRAAISIPANIAEGQGKIFRKEFLRHLSIARGSLCELETHLILACRLDYLNEDELTTTWKSIQSVGRLLNGLIRALDTGKPATDHRPLTTERAEG